MSKRSTLHTTCSVAFLILKPTTMLNEKEEALLNILMLAGLLFILVLMANAHQKLKNRVEVLEKERIEYFEKSIKTIDK